MKLLILSASTGGGHDMRAFALQYWWKKLGLKAEVYHPLESGSALYRFGTELYNFIQKKAPWAHRFYFCFLEHANLHRSTKTLIGKKKFISFLGDCKPKIIVSMHAHLNHAYLDIAKKHIPNLKFVIYCGEFADGDGFSRHWINPKADLFTGPFTSTCSAAKKYGMPESKLKKGGFLLRKAFYEKNKFEKVDKLLKSFGINPSAKFILLGTGANGTNNHPLIYQKLVSLSKTHDYKQVVALCGKNHGTMKRLLEYEGENAIKLIALPEVDAESMAALLSQASCLLARPGAGLSAEAIAMGTPVIFNLCGGVMPQETNNLNYWILKKGKYFSIKTAQDLPPLLSGEIPSLQDVLPAQPPLIEMLQSLAIDD